MSRLHVLWIGLLLVACGTASSVPAPTAQPQAIATVVLPTATTPAQPTPASATALPPTAATVPTNTPAVVVEEPKTTGVAEFTTPEGYHGLGNIDAPATMVMYSDVF
jgi:protein-disulfide isomerase